MPAKEQKEVEKYVDYAMAIQNLTDIMIDDEKFTDFIKNIYDAIDTDNEGSLPIPDVIEFCRKFLKGDQVEGKPDTSFEADH